MQNRLRPTAEIAEQAILVGDPGRSLLLAQELLEQPKMSNHARGLWGYTGSRPDGEQQLTIQATGIGGPSAAVVVDELVSKHGVTAMVRVGSCLTGGDGAAVGDLVLVGEAIAAGGSGTALGVPAGGRAAPDAKLTDALGEAIGGVSADLVASVDFPGATAEAPEGAVAVDMQTLAVLARAAALGARAAAVLVAVDSIGRNQPIDDERRDELAKSAGRAAAAALEAG